MRTTQIKSDLSLTDDSDALTDVAESTFFSCAHHRLLRVILTLHLICGIFLHFIFHVTAPHKTDAFFTTDTVRSVGVDMNTKPHVILFMSRVILFTSHVDNCQIGIGVNSSECDKTSFVLVRLYP